MTHLSIRRAAPWLIAGTALATTVPISGALASAPGQPSTPGSSVTASSSSFSHITRSGSIASFSALAQKSSSSASTSDGKGPDALQVPHHGGGTAAATSTKPSTQAPATLAVPTVPATPVSNTSTAVKSFPGIDAYQQRYVASSGNQFTDTPPDQGLCVGNGYVVEMVNSAIRIYDPNGNALSPPVGLNAFYGYPPGINRSTGERGPQTTDPTCYYDPQYSRWFAVILTLDTNPTTGALTKSNHLDIAVSASNNPLGGWVKYSVAAQDDGTGGSQNHNDCPCIGDYPHIGADQNGFYITTNEYPFSSGPGEFGNNFNGAQVYAFSKFSLAQNSGSIPMVHLAHLHLADGTPSFTLWPSEVPGTAYDTRNNGTEWFTQSTAAIQETNNAAGMSNNIAVWQLTNTASIDSGTPALTMTSNTLASEVYGVPPPAEQRFGPVPLRDCLITGCLANTGPSRSEVEGPADSNDTRMQSAWLASNHLFAALDTIASVNGRYQAGVAWFVVDVTTNTAPAISTQGYNAVAAGNITYPSIATLPNGTGVMALSLMGQYYYPSAAYLNINLTGTTGSVTVARAGAGPLDDFCQYTFFNCAANPNTNVNRPRYGDYGAAVVSGTQIWIASEYVGQSCTIDQYQADPHCGGTRAVLTNWDTRITHVSG